MEGIGLPPLLFVNLARMVAIPAGRGVIIVSHVAPLSCDSGLQLAASLAGLREDRQALSQPAGRLSGSNTAGRPSALRALLTSCPSSCSPPGTATPGRGPPPP